MARRPSSAALLLLASYVLVAFLYFGLRALGHTGRTYIGTPNADAQLEIWAFAWWPHAILHGHSPFYTHALWAPTGVELAWPTMAPGLALVFAPLTYVIGPNGSYDVCATLMPALSAWTAFLLCRHVSRSFWASLAGGYVFGFSAYELGSLQHIQLTGVFLIPLVALVVLRYLEGAYTRRGFALRFGVLAAAELSISTELSFTMALALLGSLVLAYLLVPATRARLRTIPLPLVGGYAFGGVFASPLAYELLKNFHGHPFNPVSPTQWSADVLNAVIPSDILALGTKLTSISNHFTGSRWEQSGYYGLPALVVLVWFALRRWRAPSTRFLVVAIALGIFFSYGAWLHVRGHQTVTLPWEHIAYLPLFSNVLTVRFSMYVTLGIAVVLALWASSATVPMWARVALPTLAVLAFFPNLTRNDWAITTQEPAFIRSHIYQRCLTRTDNVLIFPGSFHGNEMLWQADAWFGFRMAEGYVSAVPPKEFQQPRVVNDIATYGETSGDNAAAVREYARLKHVTVVLAELGPVWEYADGRWQLQPNPWPRRLAPLGTPLEIGGVLVYRLDGSKPCVKL
ncbi:MAG: hypothetical protein JO017_03195 [Actinobacteria bacterium]|nr:hypothetical protein [Actinomycetota bacterium]